jgi:hypothetical protein
MLDNNEELKLAGRKRRTGLAGEHRKKEELERKRSG